ncbi:MAG: ABC transporter ATP-binding protein [Phycisphaerales bacterium]
MTGGGDDGVPARDLPREGARPTARGAAPALRIDGVSKAFEIHASPARMLLNLIGLGGTPERFTALDRVSLEIARGEVVAIVGRNGAGKSTLLKIVAGTLAADAGTVAIDGRLSAILELGTGFHPDYTGRENIVMGGLCLGMSRREILAKQDEVAAFSELGEFLDRPFRTYSSGMQARLCFSTALACEPAILVVDEALSVGDVRFQRKCFAHFEQLRARGTTILLVSHDMNAVAQICDRAVWLERGRVVATGTAKQVTEDYLRAMLAGDAAQSAAARPASDGARSAPAGALGGDLTPEMRYGSGAAVIERVELLGDDGAPADLLRPRAAYRLRATVRAVRPLDDLHVGFAIRTVRGVEVFSINPRPQRVAPIALAPGEAVAAEVAFTNHLAPGDYFLTVGAWGLGEDAHHDRRVDVLQLRVAGDIGALTQSLVDLDAEYRFVPAAEPAR